MLWLSMLTMAACVIRVNILCLRLCDSVVAGYIRRRIEFVVCRELQFYLNWFLNFEWCLRLWHMRSVLAAAAAFHGVWRHVLL